jgi:puromycin-sensitive aminopeptidase
MKKKVLKKAKKSLSVRLPAHVSPTVYHVTLKPDLEAFTFEGEETIELMLSKPTKTISLHSKDLDITLVELLPQSEGGVPMQATVSYNDENETATFTFPKSILKGEHKLRLFFRGILANNMRGFYKSQYVLDGKTHTLATTQFEATDARRAIPCFDEPMHKAVFNVKLVVPISKTAISNTLPTEVIEHEAGYKLVSFAPTPKMSTYLLAFIVGDFEHIEAKSKSGVTVRVYATPGKKHQSTFALETAVRVLDFYEDYFGITYPLNTLDMIAIPDFASGAMENWGAVTYRETALLVDPEHSSTKNRQWVALVIAHELAHQWFGNLVTMEWWTHLWLNEGFASYIEYLAVDHLFPEWDIWTQFAYADLGIALRLDALKHTHPIEVDVKNPNEIGEIFDEVSYSKGASVIRMLAGYLGEHDFREGLRLYLTKHSYANAHTVHLWEAFEFVSKKPVKKLMQAWTRKSGYPLLEIAEKDGAFEVKQSRFLSSPISAKEVRDATLWSVPVNYFGDRGTTRAHLLTKKKDRVPSSYDLWKKWNRGETGFYRVRYPKEALELLATPVREGRLPAIDRLGIIRDLFALSEAGHISTVEALSFAKNYSEETDYTVWVELLSGLARIWNLFAATKEEQSYKRYALSIISKAAENIGWDPKTGENYTTSLLRPTLLSHAGLYGDARVIIAAKKRFEARAEQPIPADMRGVVYGLVASNGGEKEYGQLLALYKSATVHEEKVRILYALGQFENKKLLKQTLAFGLSDEVRLQDRNSVFASVLGNPFGRALAWDFIQKNWKKLVAEYGEGGHLLARLVKPLGGFTDKKDGDSIKKFFKKNKAPAGERTVLQVLEHVYSNAAWKKRDAKKIAHFL